MAVKFTGPRNEEMSTSFAFHYFNACREGKGHEKVDGATFAAMADTEEGREQITEMTDSEVEVHVVEPVAAPVVTREQPNVVGIQMSGVAAFAILTSLCRMSVINKGHFPHIARELQNFIDAGGCSKELFAAELADLLKKGA